MFVVLSNNDNDLLDSEQAKGDSCVLVSRFRRKITEKFSRIPSDNP